MSVRTLTLAAAAVSALVLAPLPAYAETVTTHDAANDVRSQSASEEGPTEPAPDRVEGDALSMRVLHGPRNVRVTARSWPAPRTSRRSTPSSSAPTRGGWPSSAST